MRSPFIIALLADLYDDANGMAVRANIEASEGWTDGSDILAAVSVDEKMSEAADVFMDHMTFTYEMSYSNPELHSMTIASEASMMIRMVETPGLATAIFVSMMNDASKRNGAGLNYLKEFGGCPNGNPACTIAEFARATYLIAKKECEAVGVSLPDFRVSGPGYVSVEQATDGILRKVNLAARILGVTAKQFGASMHANALEIQNLLKPLRGSTFMSHTTVSEISIFGNKMEIAEG